MLRCLRLLHMGSSMLCVAGTTSSRYYPDLIPVSSVPGIVHPVHELQNPGDAFHARFQIIR